MTTSLLFERTHDLELVRRIITVPTIWQHAGDDSVGSPESWMPCDNPAIWYLLVIDGGVLLGMFALYPENSICWDVHTCLLPETWFSGRALEAGMGALRWMWEHSPCLRITTKVPSFNRRALHFAQNVGLIEYGRNPMSLLKGGQLHDQILLGISKPREG